MSQSRSGPRRLIALAGVMALAVVACGTSATEAPTPLITPAPIANDQPGPNGGVVVRWFVGLGAGGQPQQIAAQTQFVTDFNNSQKDVYISLEIYDNKVAANILKTQIAAGN